MNYKTLIIGIIISAVSVSAFAGHNNDRYKRHNKFQSKNYIFDYGRVRSATPIIETIEHRVPRETCRQERVRSHHQNSATPVILGSIIGAAIGNQLGHHKSNKRVGAIAGTLLGAAIGSDISKNSIRHHGGYRMQCSTDYDIEFEEQVVGYDVEYRYKGNTYYTQTREHPGKRLKLKLRIQPVPS